MRILDARNVTVREELRLETRDDGLRRIWRGNSLLADDGPDTHARATAFALAAFEQPRTIAPLVAWIGGGLCVGPRLFACCGALQTIYELEPRLGEFRPDGSTFIAGDWRDTLSGLYDVIVYDLGGEVPYDALRTHLKPGGVILPLES